MTDIKDSSGSRRLLVEVDDRERVVYEYRRLLKCTRTSCLSGAGTHGEAPQRRRRAGAGGCYVRWSWRVRVLCRRRRWRSCGQ